MNANPALLSLSEIASEAHAKIQQDFADINPVIGVMQGMRKMGIPADVLTIDCLVTNKRILVILHDAHPGIMRYQNTFIDQDPSDDYVDVTASEVTSDTLYGWIKNYFTVTEWFDKAGFLCWTNIRNMSIFLSAFHLLKVART